MPCAISCAISAIFLIGMIYFYYITDKTEIVNHYKSQLPSDLQKIYENISKERKQISCTGYIIGFILSLFIIFYNIKMKGAKLNSYPFICTIMATCFLTNALYYMLAPKRDWMLNHVNSPEQTKAWLQMYKNMSYNYHMGLALGILAVGALAFAFRC